MKLCKLTRQATAAVLASAMALSIAMPALAESRDAAVYEADIPAGAVVYAEGADTADANVVDYGITITHGTTAIKVTENNYKNILGDGTLSYDPVDHTLTGTGKFDSLVIKITSTNSVDVKLINEDGGIVVNGSLTVEGAHDVTVISKNAANSGAYGAVINGSATITECTGDILIENEGTGDVVGGNGLVALTVDGANDVKIHGKCTSYTYTVFGTANIKCDGNVELTADNGAPINHELVVTSAEDVTISGNDSYATIYSTANITCSGNVTLENKGTGKAIYDKLTYKPSPAKAYEVLAGKNADDAVSVYPNKVGNAYADKTHTEQYIRIETDVPLYTVTPDGDGVEVNGSMAAVDLKRKSTVTLTAEEDTEEKVFEKFVLSKADGTGESLTDAQLAAIGFAYDPDDAHKATFTMPNYDLKVQAVYHTHKADEGKWEFDETGHWHLCTGCDKDVHLEEAKHTFTNGVCECGYKDPDYQPSHEHTLGDWEHDETNHWKTCSVCEEKVGEAAHDFDSDGVCKECGYKKAADPVPAAKKYAITLNNCDVEFLDGVYCSENPDEIEAGAAVTLLASGEGTFTGWSLKDADGKDVEYKEVGGTRIKFEMPESTVKATAYFMSSGDEPTPTPDPDDPTPTPDTGDTGSALGAVVAGTAIGGTVLFVGYEMVTDAILSDLLPAGAATPVNRGQLAWLIWGTKGAPAPTNQPAFTDVTNAEMAQAAQWCVEQGIMTAEGNKFSPDGWVPKFKVIETWNNAFPKQ